MEPELPRIPRTVSISKVRVVCSRLRKISYNTSGHQIAFSLRDASRQTQAGRRSLVLYWTADPREYGRIMKLYNDTQSYF